MNAIKATWTNGQILPAVPVDWPEGSELLVEPVSETERIGLDESQWRDDAAALADWDAWITTIEPLDLTDDERISMEQFRSEVRRASIDAVRKQMGLGD